MFARLALLTVMVTLATGCQYTSRDDHARIDSIIRQTEQHHGLDSWHQQENVRAKVDVIFGLKRLVQGEFTWQANGPKARWDAPDGSEVLYDGQTCWVTPPLSADSMDRFHVLTWPWFLMAPFKLQGEGIRLSDYQKMELEGKTYHTILQTFDKGEGDTPDDWYRLFIDPKTYELAAMAYIVTYNKSAEEANKKPSIILYRNYQRFGGCLISQRQDFYYWSEDTGIAGEHPKGMGTVDNVSFPAALPPNYFSRPANAAEVSLPNTD